MKVWPKLLGLGIIGLLAYLLIFVFSIGYMVGMFNEPGVDNSVGGEILLIFCTPTLFLPSVILTIFGYLSRSKYKELEDVAYLLKAYRQIEISELAKKVGKDEQETEELISKCLKKKLIDGHLNHSEKKFYTVDFKNQFDDSIKGWKCPACGGYNDRIILPGESAKCSYCGKLLPAGSIESGSSNPSPPSQTTPPQSSPPPPPPLPPPPPQHDPITKCQQCNSPLVYISQYSKWYCNQCRKYA